MSNTKSIFEQLKSLTSKYVKHFKTDFEYDQKAIEENPNRKFIHIAREHGTHMSVFYDSELFPKAGEKVKYLFGTADRKGILNGNIECFNHYIENNPLSVYYFDGSKLKKITIEKAKNIFQKYIDGIHLEWEKQEVINI